MIDILLGIVWVFVMVVIIIAIILLAGWGIIKFFEFWKDKEGDDYKR